MHWIKEKIVWFHWSMDPKTTWLTVHPVASWYFSHGWEFCQTLEPKYWTFLSFLCANECEYLVEWTSSNSSRKKKKEKTLCAKLLNPLLLTDMSRERKEICCSYNISFQAQKQFRWNWDSFSREYAMKMLSALQLYGAQRAKFAKKVHKPPLRVNVINFEHKYGSLGVPQTPKSHDALKEVFKFIRNKLHCCTFTESEMLKIYFEVCEPFLWS